MTKRWMSVFCKIANITQRFWCRKSYPAMIAILLVEIPCSVKTILCSAEIIPCSVE